jgi:hypothetical protein
MVDVLATGMHLRLPSGNVVRLIGRDGEDWVCEYTAVSKARGEVIYTETFLKSFAVVV